MPKRRRPIILANKLYVPHRLVERSDLERWSYDWVETLWEDVVDEYGVVALKDNGEPQVRPVEEDRHLVTCQRVYTGMGDYYGFPRGNLKKLRPYLREPNVIDLRSAPPLGFPLRMRKTTVKDPRWEAQANCIKGWYKKGGGIVQGTTGSGKTVVGVGQAVKMGLRTLVLSKRKDAFKNVWHPEFYNHTNLGKLEREMGVPLIGEFKSTKKKSVFPITIGTIQSFISKKGRQRLAQLQDYFGLIILDEAHELCTEEFSIPIMYMNPLIFSGLTATPERSDNRHLLLYDMVGPIAAVNETAQMPPEVTFIRTGTEAPEWLNRKPYDRRYKWTMSLSHISKAGDRTDIIERWVRHDVERQRNIAVYSERRQIIQALRDSLKKDGYKVGYVDGNTKNRETIYNTFCEGGYDVLLAGKVLDALVNLPEMDNLHICTPVNKEAAILQIYGRVRRVKAGKESTEVRYYVDHGGQLSGAYKNNRRICKEQGWAIAEEDTRITIGAEIWVHPSKR